MNRSERRAQKKTKVPAYRNMTIEQRKEKLKERGTA